MTGKTGSLRYMAPEVWREENYTHKIDVFSFAILAWEVLARKRAYEDLRMTPDVMVRAVANRNLRPKMAPKWPGEVCRLLAISWHSEPGSRPDFAEMLPSWESLLQFAGSTPKDEPNPVLNALDVWSPGACCALM